MENLETAVMNYMNKMYNSYSETYSAEKNPEMNKDYKDGLAIAKGKKYWKVCTGANGMGKSVHCFIVAVDNDKDFPLGTILKPAGWKGPARNFSRGNVFDNDLNVHWLLSHTC